MCSGAGDAFSRRRGASLLMLILNTTLCFLFHFSLCLLPARFLWIVGGSRSRRMLRWRRELQLFVVHLSAVLPLQVVLIPAMSREDSLAAALLWCSGSDPVAPPSDCRLSSQAVDLVQIFQPRMEPRIQLSHLISSSSRRPEFHRPLCSVAPHLTGDRSINTTCSDPSLWVTASYGAWVRARFSQSSMSSRGIVLFRSSSSYEEKPLPPYTLPMARGASSDLLPSVCFSFFIVLSSCGAVSMGPEDTSEITSVVLVDGVWTPTSLNVTILELYDFVVKAFPMHSSIVLNPLSSSFEDLSYLAYLHAGIYAYCKRGWLIPSCYCSEES
ncbi:unnamed protein product [Brassica rapa subsp. trilocularis]